MSNNPEPKGLDSKQEWVHFDDEGRELNGRANSPAILDTQAVQVTLENNRTTVNASTTSPIKNVTRSLSEAPSGKGSLQLSNPPRISMETESGHSVSPLNPAQLQLQNVPLSDQAVVSSFPQPSSHQQMGSTIRQGFANGDVIVTILPQNSFLPWITPAKFRPELVPEELMAQGLTLTVEDYVHVMSQLVNDHRFTVYNICYKRVLIAWITLAFFILLCILFGNFPHLVMFGAGIAWLMVNAGAIFFCMWIKIRLNKNLELCMSRINNQLMRHKILLGVDDRGKISCHKINLCFIYFDPQDCIDKLQKIIDQDSNEAARNGPDHPNRYIPTVNERYDLDDPEIVITGATNTRISRYQNHDAECLLARYSQRWAKLMMRGDLALGIDAALSPSFSSRMTPRHMATCQCLCQYIEDYLRYKPQGKCSICSQMAEFMPNFVST